MVEGDARTTTAGEDQLTEGDHDIVAKRQGSATKSSDVSKASK